MKVLVKLYQFNGFATCIRAQEKKKKRKKKERRKRNRACFAVDFLRLQLFFSSNLHRY